MPVKPAKEPKLNLPFRDDASNWGEEAGFATVWLSDQTENPLFMLFNAAV